MLSIRQAQVVVLEKSLVASAELRLAGYIQESFPRDADALGPAHVRGVVRFGMERARLRGHRTEREIYLFLTLAFMLGSYFDEDPQLEWAGRILQDPAETNSAVRLDRLHDEALRYLDQVAGVNNEHLRRALVRLKNFDFNSAQGIAAERLETGIAGLLESFYPQKASYQGEAATREVVARGVRLAADYGLSGSEGAFLMSVLLFMLGWGVDRDPIIPWVEELLRQNGPRDADAKTQHLYAAALKLLSPVWTRSGRYVLLERSTT